MGLKLRVTNCLCLLFMEFVDNKKNMSHFILRLTLKGWGKQPLEEMCHWCCHFLFFSGVGRDQMQSWKEIKYWTYHTFIWWRYNSRGMSAALCLSGQMKSVKSGWRFLLTKWKLWKCDYFVIFVYLYFFAVFVCICIGLIRALKWENLKLISLFLNEVLMEMNQCAQSAAMYSQFSGTV